VLRANLAATRLTADARVHATSVDRFLAVPDRGPWDLAILDPPYESRDIVAPLRAVTSRLAPGATVVVKHFWRTELPEVAGLVATRQRRFGETMLTFLGRAEDA
jgi:16S rRNA G966 N2-methylase RsmD